MLNYQCVFGQTALTEVHSRTDLPTNMLWYSNPQSIGLNSDPGGSTVPRLQRCMFDAGAHIGWADQCESALQLTQFDQTHSLNSTLAIISSLIRITRIG